MKNAAIALSATLLAFFSMIQPCPAPPLVVGIVAGTAMGAGAATAGAAAASRGGGRRRGIDASGFDQCVTQGINSAQQISMLPNSSIVISGLPQPCMTEIEQYNQRPQINDLNSVHGSTNVINADSVRLDDMPEYVLAAITAARDQMESNPIPSRR